MCGRTGGSRSLVKTPKASLTKRGLWALCGRMGGGYQKTIVGEGEGAMWELCGRGARKPYLGGGRGDSVT